MKHLLPACAVLMLLISSCKVTKPVRPMEEYEERFREQVSIINIPIDVPLRDLETVLNKQLSGILYEDNNLRDGDKMMVRATKQDDIRLGLDTQAITYRIPLDLWIKYDLGISTVEAKGQISLDFKTGFGVNPDWSISTLTTLEGHEWNKKPRVKMGFVDLPVGFIADLVLRNSTVQISKAIDDLVSDQFDLRNTVEEAWGEMFQPALVSEAYSTWLTVNPQFIGMSPISTENGRIATTIYVEGKPSVRIGERPDPKYVQPLPPLRISSVEKEDFTLHINAEISYNEAERLAKTQLVGETFSYGRRAVTIEDLEFFGKGSNIVINTTLSGTYNGSVYLVGRPVFNPKKNTIDIEDLEYTLDTKSYLFRSAGWLMKSTIKNKIAENLNFLLDYNMKDMQQLFQEQLQEYELASGVVLNGNLEALDLRNAYLSVDGMVVDIALKGNVNVRVKGLN